MPNGTSFDLTPEQEEAQRKAQEAQIQANGGRMPLDPKAIRNPTDNPNMDPNGVSLAGTDPATADRNARNSIIDAQSQNAGVQRADVQTNAQGIAGFFGGKDTANNYSIGKMTDPNAVADRGAIQQRIAGVDARPTLSMGPASSTAATLDQGVANQSRGLALDARGQQQGLASILQRGALGLGPSAAQAQLQAGTDASLASALALARSQRGGDQSTALRLALNQNGQTMQQAANASAQLKAQEQQAAQAQLGGLLTGTRAQDLQLQGQDLNAATVNAQLGQQTAISNAQLQQQAGAANLAAGVEQQKQKDAMVAQLMQMGLTFDQATHQAEVQQAQYNAGLLAQQDAARQGIAVQNSAQGAQVTGAVAGAIGTGLAAALSDQREKTDIEDGTPKLEGFLGAIGAHSYKYKKPKLALRGEGTFVSPMAQELEKTELGKAMVKEAPDGTKVVDYGKGFGTMLASMTMLFNKVKKLEAAYA